jgi:hypothetical protein
MSIIDDPMFDSGVYSNIGSNSFFKCKLLQFEQPVSLSVHWLHDVNVDEELDQLKTSMIQIIDLVDDAILYSGRGNEKDTH